MKFERFLPLVVVIAAACGHVPAPKTAKPTEPTTRPFRAKAKLMMEPIQLQAVKGTGSDPEVVVLEAGALFEQGGQHLSAKRYRQALVSYDKLLEHFPKSRFVSPTLYNAGLCHEWLGEFAPATKRYKELIRRFGHTKEAVDAGFRLGGCYAELHNWPASAQVFATLLLRQDLSASDRIEATARKGLAHFRLGDHRSCKSTLQSAIQYSKKIETVERLDTDFFLAMAHYYLAAIPHVDFRKVKVERTKFAQTLDEKARLLLLSQARYIRTIKVKNPYWATAAGFQIGSLYREFYRVLVTTLPDFSKAAARNAKKAGITAEQARTQLVQVYMEEVHKAVKPLLSKAIRVFEKNVLMAERVGVRSNWVGKSKRQVQDLKHLLTLPPKEAVKLVTKDETLPEDQQAPIQPGAKDPAGSEPSKKKKDPRPAAPTSPPVNQPDEPGRVIL
jgi:TolA-binding protein